MTAELSVAGTVESLLEAAARLRDTAVTFGPLDLEVSRRHWNAFLAALDAAEQARAQAAHPTR